MPDGEMLHRLTHRGGGTAVGRDPLYRQFLGPHPAALACEDRPPAAGRRPLLPSGRFHRDGLPGRCQSSRTGRGGDGPRVSRVHQRPAPPRAVTGNVRRPVRPTAGGAGRRGPRLLGADGRAKLGRPPAGGWETCLLRWLRRPVDHRRRWPAALAGPMGHRRRGPPRPSRPADDREQVQRHRGDLRQSRRPGRGRRHFRGRGCAPSRPARPGHLARAAGGLSPCRRQSRRPVCPHQYPPLPPQRPRSPGIQRLGCLLRAAAEGLRP